MKKLLLGFAVAIGFAIPLPSALAADLEPPPPVNDLRPATFDWTGPYVGLFAQSTFVDGTFDGTCSCGAVYTNMEHSGTGFGGGVLAGVNYQMDDFVFGIEADIARNRKVATNDEPTIGTDLYMDYIATARGRAGWADGNTLLYVTGGLAAVDLGFHAMMSSGERQDKWIFGWVAGGGIEHAFTDNLRGRLEYLYMGLPDTKFSLTDIAATTLDATQSFNSVQMVRAGLTYNFTW